MLNTRKLLYILPDVAYVAELLPGKKEHSFAIQSFRQINGEFMKDEEFVPEHIDKLFSKIEADEYQLVLPDFVFTNTIVEVADTAESKVKAHLKDVLLPELKLSKDTHEIDTFILTQHQGKTKVQLAALEKTVLTPIAQSAAQYNVVISLVSSLSWTVKSVISLEPSISIVQAGANLYLAEHYIGVDQTTAVPVDDIQQLGETIRTLKGAEPSIQTIYLLTNGVVEESLKEQLSSLLPLQQLASFKEDETQMPSYVKHLIESGQKSLDIAEYKVPAFSLGKAAPKAADATDAAKEVAPEKTTDKPVSTTDDLADDEDDSEADTDAADLPLPMPTPAAAALPAATEVVKALPGPKVNIDLLDEENDEEDADEIVSPDETPQTDTPEVPEISAKEEATILAKLTKKDEPHDQDTDLSAVESNVVPADLKQLKPDLEEDKEDDTKDDGKPLFEPSKIAATPETQADKPSSSTTPVIAAPTPAVIKNKSGVNNMLKMVFVTLVVFFLTVAIGVGVGYGVLSMNSKMSAAPSPSPSAMAVASVAPSPSPTASASAAIKKSELSILVVNATTTPGYAGKTKKALETAGYKKVVAGNAKGEYEPGTYVLMAEKNAGLIEALTKDASLTLTYQADSKVEDTKAEYDAVIVLAE